MAIGESKRILGMVKVGERGQIVIPKEARKMFNIKAGDILVVLADEDRKGIILVKSDLIERKIFDILG